MPKIKLTWFLGLMENFCLPDYPHITEITTWAGKYEISRIKEIVAQVEKINLPLNWIKSSHI